MTNLMKASSLCFPWNSSKTIFLTCDLIHSISPAPFQNMALCSPVALLTSGFTLRCSVSTLGKHWRKLHNIWASLRVPKYTFNAKIRTLGTMVLGRVCTLMVVVPICSKCRPGSRYPSDLNPWARPILILVENFLPSVAQISLSKSRSRHGASTAARSATQEKPSCTQRRLWLTKRRRTTFWLRTTVSISRTGLLEIMDSRSRSSMSTQQRPSSSRCGKAVLPWGRPAVLGNLHTPM
ncbi:hypothetical protein EE612_005259 [Oryza sativa]|nr:hypothetical protein EE612_005259 [Oryza sativa]